MESYTRQQYYQTYHESNILDNILLFLKLNLDLKVLLILSLYLPKSLLKVNFIKLIFLIKLLKIQFQKHTNQHFFHMVEQYQHLYNRNIQNMVDLKVNYLGKFFRNQHLQINQLLMIILVRHFQLQNQLKIKMKQLQSFLLLHY